MAVDNMDNKAIISFSGDNAFLSNFYMHPLNFCGVIWPTAEHLYQAMKACTDADDVRRIRNARTPGIAKQIGRTIECVPNWESERVSCMKQVIGAKFNDEEMARRLIATGDAVLIEGNGWHDNFWGDCRCSNCRREPKANKLGRILMETRSLLQEL